MSLQTTWSYAFFLPFFKIFANSVRAENHGFLILPQRDELQDLSNPKGSTERDLQGEPPEKNSISRSQPSYSCRILLRTQVFALGSEINTEQRLQNYPRLQKDCTIR